MEQIYKPSHYCFSKYEPKDVIRDWGLNFNLGSAVKYIARAGKKDDAITDLKKAIEFLRFEIAALECKKEIIEEFTTKEIHEICVAIVEAYMEGIKDNKDGENNGHKRDDILHNR